MIETQNIKTKAYVLKEPKTPFVLADVVLDGVQENEVLVEMKYTGICHSDLSVQSGLIPVQKFPAVVGHEGAGIVRQVGSGVPKERLAPGDLVQLSFRSCGDCRACTEGRNGSCPSIGLLNVFLTARSDGTSPISLPDGTSVYGQFFGQSSFSKMAIVPLSSTIKVGVPPDDLAFFAPLSCGYMTGAGTVFNVLKPNSQDSIAILGAGSVGLAAMLAAKSLGLEKVVAVDILDEKLKIASELGAMYTINSRTSADFNAAIREVLPNGVDFIVDTTSVKALIEASFHALAHSGTLALVGAAAPDAKIEMHPSNFVGKSLRVVGVTEGASDPRKFIPDMIRLYREGKMPLDRLAKVYPATDLEQAIEDLKKGKVVKPVLSWEGIC